MKTLITALAILSFQNVYAQTQVNEADIKDAYNYFLGRLLILRQEHIDFKMNGYEWNKLYHREVGKVTWATPNLDVTYSEAWLGLDKNSCAIVDIPEIKKRYYTFQVLNSWGETVSNINERKFPKHPFGKFAYCTKDSVVTLDKSIVKIPVEGHKFRVLARIELGKDPEEAVKLQKNMFLTMEGTPQIAKAVEIPMFDNKALIGAEGFDNADAILKSEPDINPGMEPLQKKARKVSAAIKDKKDRERIDKYIKAHTIPAFFAKLDDQGERKNGWMHPNTFGNYGSNYLDRTMVNFAGIWANNKEEAIYFGARASSDGEDLKGVNAYTMTFPKNDLPQNQVNYFWSVIAVDRVDFHVMKNPENKYLINNQTPVKYNPDGSLTLVFASDLPLGFDKANWIPTDKRKTFNLTFRLYGPKNDKYFPPEVHKLDRSIEAEEDKPDEAR